MTDVESVAGRVLSLVSARAVGGVVAFLSTPVVVRVLGPAGYGDYAVLLSVFAVWMLPASASVTEGVQKFVGEARPARRDAEGTENAGGDTDVDADADVDIERSDDAGGREARAGEEVAWVAGVVQFYVGFGGVLVLASVVVLVAFTALGGASWLFGDGFALLFYVLAAHVFVAQFRAIGQHAVLGFGAEHVSAAFDVAKKVATVCVGVGLVVLAEIGVLGMLVGHVVANALVAVAAAVVVVRTVGVGPLSRPSLDSIPVKELLSFNLMNVVLVVLVRSMAHVDVVVLRAFAGPATTGFYRAALSTAEYVWLVPMALQTVLLTSSASLWADGDVDAITAVAAKATRYTLLLVVLLAIGLAVLADAFVPLYFGGEFAAAVVPLLVLLPGVVGFALARPLQAIVQGSGRLRTLVVAVAGAATLNVALNAALVPGYGMLGAAVATSIGYGSMFAFLVWTAYRLGFDPLADVRPVRVAVTATLTAPVVWGVDRVLASDGLALAVVPPVGLLVYVAVAVAVGAIDTAELSDAVEHAPAPVGRPLRRALAYVE